MAPAAEAVDLDVHLPPYRPAAVSRRIHCSAADTMLDLTASWSRLFHRHQPDAMVAVDHYSKLTANGCRPRRLTA
jgi:hypothetical protein